MDREQRISGHSLQWIADYCDQINLNPKLVFAEHCSNESFALPADVSWLEYQQVLFHLHRLISDEDFEKAGSQAWSKEPLRLLGLSAQILSSTRDIYLEAFGPQGAALADFPVNGQLETLAPGELNITVAAATPVALPFFKHLATLMKSLPTMQSRPPATVNFSYNDKNATYRISYITTRSRYERLQHWFKARMSTGKIIALANQYQQALNVTRRQLLASKPETFSENTHQTTPRRPDSKKDLPNWIPIPWLSINTQNTITDCNHLATELLKYSTSTLIGRKIEELIPASLASPPFREFLSTTHQTDAWHKLKARLITSDKQLLSVEISCVVTEADSRNILINDVSLMDQLQRKLKHTQLELTKLQRAESLGHFTTEIVHDFNNLLFAISGYAELAAKHSDPKGHIEEISSASRRATHLIRQLLNFDSDAGQTQATIEINKTVHDLKSLLTRIMPADISINYNLGKGPLVSNTDQSRLERYIMNLLTNSRDAMPHGGNIVIGTGSRIIGAEFMKQHTDAKPGNFVWLAVSDTGHGIPAEQLKQVRQPFFTTKEPGQGTGVGLSIIDKHLREDGGFLTIDSTPGTGTTVKLFLPASTKSLTTDQQCESEDDLRGDERILLIDDESTTLELTYLMLSAAGYTVTKATDGSSALEALQKQAQKPDLVLMDVVLTGMSSSVLCERIRSLQPQTPVLFMSGYPELSDRASHVGESNYPLLTKPFDTSILRQAVREVFDGQHEA